MVKDVLGLKAPLSFFYEKKPVVLVFFSLGCSYCKQEIPALKSFYNEYRDDFYIIAVVTGQNNKDVKQYAIDNKINFILSTDTNGNILNQYNIKSAPYHIIINKKGNIIDHKKGVTSFNELKYLTKKFIN